MSSSAAMPDPAILPVLYRPTLATRLKPGDIYCPACYPITSPGVWAEVDHIRQVEDDVLVWHSDDDEDPASFDSLAPILICCYDPNEAAERARFVEAAAAAQFYAASQTDSPGQCPPPVNNDVLVSSFMLRRQAAGILSAPTSPELVAGLVELLTEDAGRHPATR